MAGVLANATAVVHFLSLLYIGLGGFVGWKWPRTLFVHIFFAAWGFIVILVGLPCPLTSLQDYFRHVRGMPSLPGGFNEYYIYGELIPHSALPVVAVGAIALLVISYAGAYVRLRRNRAGAGSAAVSSDAASSSDVGNSGAAADTDGAAAQVSAVRPVSWLDRERTSRSDRVGRP